MMCIEFWSLPFVGTVLAYTLGVVGLTAIIAQRKARWTQ